ncbi:MAG: extracellular solute-binding protein [Eubacteriales bacterium]|nr:extracellular solute-binding protein [Eubacteriales bacterium]
MSTSKKRNALWRLLSFLVAAALLAGCLAGCGSLKKEDDVVTIWSGSKNAAIIARVIQDQFPDMKLDIRYYAGGDTTNFLKNELVHGNGSDIFLFASKIENNLAREWLLDLSGYSFMGNIESSMLNMFDVDGEIYQMSSAVNSRMIIYNKTLFDMNGWKVPENFGELVDVCRQIREEQPDIVPIGMGYATDALPFLVMTSFAQAGFMGTLDGMRWEEQYLAGNASIREGFAEGMEQFARLIDVGAFQHEGGYEGLWGPGWEYLGNRKMAMGIITGDYDGADRFLRHDPSLSDGYGEYRTDDFQVLPFFGSKDGNKALTLGLGMTFGLNKRLKEKGNEKKLESALKIMDYLTSSEGQASAKLSDAQIVMSKDGAKNAPDYLKKWWDPKANVTKAIYIYSGYEDIFTESGKLIVDAIDAGNADGLVERFVETADRLHQEALNNDTSTDSVGELSEDLDTDQTAQLYRNIMQDAVAARNLADFTLTTHNATDARGNFFTVFGFGGKLYKGAVNASNLNIPMGELSSSIGVVSLTGAEVKDILNDGLVFSSEVDNVEMALPYGWSGLDVTLTKDGKVESAKLNGEELKDDAVYKVAMIVRNYPDSFAEAHEITDTEIKITSLLEPYFRANSPVKAPEVYRSTSIQLASQSK